jgi:hypothetical protein
VKPVSEKMYDLPSNGIPGADSDLSFATVLYTRNPMARK